MTFGNFNKPIIEKSIERGMTFGNLEASQDKQPKGDSSTNVFE
jgi:hypothetical protein